MGADTGARTASGKEGREGNSGVLKRDPLFICAPVSGSEIRTLGSGLCGPPDAHYAVMYLDLVEG
jgi:hypothetical protein